MPKSPYVLLLTSVALFVLVGCLAKGTSQIPPSSQFRSPAIGTPMPATINATQIRLPPNSSGVLFVNQTGNPVRVAVSDTITTIPAGQSFLFVLPANTYQFYIYEVGISPKARTERTEEGKMRYIYLLPLPKPTSG